MNGVGVGELVVVMSNIAGGGVIINIDVVNVVGGGVVDVHGELLLLPLPGLVVLEPVEHILPLDLAVLPEPGGDPLDLLRGGGPDPIDVVELPQDPDLVCCGYPPAG